jgi:hypothetical protein
MNTCCISYSVNFQKLIHFFLFHANKIYTFSAERMLQKAFLCTYPSLNAGVCSVDSNDTYLHLRFSDTYSKVYFDT